MSATTVNVNNAETLLTIAVGGLPDTTLSINSTTLTILTTGAQGVAGADGTDGADGADAPDTFLALTDTEISNPADGQLAVYEAGKLKNKSHLDLLFFNQLLTAAIYENEGFNELVLDTDYGDGGQGVGKVRVEKGRMYSFNPFQIGSTAWEFDCLSKTSLDYVFTIKNGGVDALKITPSGSLVLNNEAEFKKDYAFDFAFKAGGSAFNINPLVGILEADNSFGLMVFINGLNQLAMGGGSLSSSGATKMDLGTLLNTWGDFYCTGNIKTDVNDGGGASALDGVVVENLAMTHVDSKPLVIKNNGAEILSVSTGGNLNLIDSAQFKKSGVFVTFDFVVGSSDFSIIPEIGLFNANNAQNTITFASGGLFAVTIASSGFHSAGATQLDLGKVFNPWRDFYMDGIFKADNTISSARFESATDGSTVAVNAYDFDTADISTAGSNIAVFKNDGVEKALIDKDGNIECNYIEQRKGLIHLQPTTIQNVGGVVGTIVAIDFDTVALSADTDVFTHDAVTNPSRIQVLKAARYSIKASIREDNQGSVRFLAGLLLRVNGATLIERSCQVSYDRGLAYGGNSVSIDSEIDLAENDYVEVVARVEYTSATYVVNTRPTCSECIIKII